MEIPKKARYAAIILLLLVGISVVLAGLVGMQRTSLYENALEDAVKQYCGLLDGDFTHATYEIVDVNGAVEIICRN